MAQNTLQFESRFTDVILTADVESGDVVTQGNIIGISVSSGKSGEKIAIDTEGVKLLPATTAFAFFVGDELHWDVTNEEVTTDISKNLIIGTVYKAKGISEDTAQVKLHSFLTSLGGTITPDEMEGTIVGGIVAFDTELVGTTIPPGSTSQILTSTDTSSLPTFKDLSLVDDKTPQLGGNLDVNGNSIVDGSGNELIQFGAITNAVNNIIIRNSTGEPSIATIGTGAGNVGLKIHSKGGGSAIELYNANLVNGKYLFKFDGGTTGTALTLQQAQTTDVTVTFPDDTGTLALTSETISALVDDTSPTLGGDLDVNDFKFTSNAGDVLKLTGTASGPTYMRILAGNNMQVNVVSTNTSASIRFVTKSSTFIIGDTENSSTIQFDVRNATSGFAAIFRSPLLTQTIVLELPVITGTLALKSDTDLVKDLSPQLGGLLDLNGNLFFNDNTGLSGENVLIQFVNVDNDEGWLKITNSTLSGDVLLEAAGSGDERLVLASGANKNVAIGDKTNSKFIDFNLSGALGSTTTTLIASQQADRSITLPDASTTLVGTTEIAELTNKKILSGKYDQLNDVNGNEMFVFNPVALATEHLEVFNGINVNVGAVGLEVKGLALNTNLDFISRGNASQVRFYNNVTGGQLGIKTNQSTAGKAMTLESQHTDDRFLQLPDATGTLALTSETISALVDDTSPTLGGDLDVNDFKFTSNTGDVLKLTGTASGPSYMSLLAGNNIQFNVVSTNTSASIRFATKSSTFIIGDAETSSTIQFDVRNATSGFAAVFRSPLLTQTIVLELPVITGTLALKSDTDLVNDTSPQLGGDLDLNNNNITLDGKNILSATLNGDAVNYFNINATRTGIPPAIEVVGPDTQTDMVLHSKGAGSKVIFGNTDKGDLFVFDSSLLADNHNGVYSLLLPEFFSDNACIFPLTSTTLIGDDTTNILTNKNLDADGSGNSITNLGSGSIKSEFITGQTEISVLDTQDELLLYDDSASALVSSKLSSLDTLFSATSKTLTDKKITSGKYDQLNDVNGNEMFVFNPVTLATEHLEVFNGINVNQGAVGLKVNGSALNTNLDLISKGNASEVRFSNNTSGGQLGIKTNSSTTFKIMTLESQHTVDRVLQLPDATGTLALTSELGISALVNDTSPQLGALLDLNGNLFFNDNTGLSGENVLIQFVNVDNDEGWLKITNSILSGDVLLEAAGSGDERLVIASGVNKNVAIGDKTDSKFIDFNLSGAQSNTTTTFIASQQADRAITLPDATGTLALTSDIGSTVGSHRTITTYTPSLQTEILITNDINATYDEYIIEGHLFVNSNNAELFIEWSNDNGASYYSLAYSIIEIGSLTVSGEAHNDGSKLIIAKDVRAVGPVDFTISLKLPLNSERQIIKGESAWLDSGPGVATATFAASDLVIESINAARITVSGNTLTGTVHMKGVVK